VKERALDVLKVSVSDYYIHRPDPSDGTGSKTVQAGK